MPIESKLSRPEIPNISIMLFQTKDRKIISFVLDRKPDGNIVLRILVPRPAIFPTGPNGEALHENEQVEEVWTGTTFGVASHMLSEGMKDEAFRTAQGVNNVVWRDRGYWFRTPEAYDANGMFRASMYMRPGAIWAMEMVPAK